jgi:hypothetical protein
MSHNCSYVSSAVLSHKVDVASIQCAGSGVFLSYSYKYSYTYSGIPITLHLTIPTAITGINATIDGLYTILESNEHYRKYLYQFAQPIEITESYLVKGSNHSKILNTDKIIPLY